MKTYRVLAGLALAGSATVLSGCEVSQVFGATCTAEPPAPHQEFGTVSMTVDVPPEVAAGDTFTVRVEHVGVGVGPQTSPPTAQLATISVTGAATPSGAIALSSFPQFVTFPVDVELTATGAAGDTIAVGLSSATQAVIDPPRFSSLACRPAERDGHVATIQVVEPT